MDSHSENTFCDNVKCKFLFLQLSILTSLFLIIYKWDPLKITNKYPAFIDSFWLIFLFFMIVSYLSTIMDLGGKFGKVILEAATLIAPLVLIITSILLLFWILDKIPSLTTFLLTVISILILAGLIGIIILLYPKIGTNNKRENIYVSFIRNFIFYIPCLMIKLAKSIKYQWNITTRPIWIILGIEIILITLRFLIPYLFNLILSKREGTILLSDPIYLNKEKTLGTFDDLHATDDNTELSPKYHYSISAWFYINPQPPNTSGAYTKYTNILNYGNKPNVQFNSLENKLRVQVELNDKTFADIYTKKGIDFQKWHNIVINYDGGNMDIFLDGDLVSSKPGIIPYMSYENIIVGAENGINGGICNVVFHKKVLTKSDIIFNYKLLRNKRFPTL